MLTAISRILRDPFLRVPTLTLFVSGLTYASTLPYQSIIGINELGLSDGIYSVLIFLAAAINVTASVILGILSDRLGQRRPLVLVLAVSGFAGFGLIYLLRSAPVFIASVLLLIPISNSTFSVLFGSIRATTNELPRREAVSITSTVRAIYSGSWALMPGLVGLYLARSSTMMPAYAVAATASAVCFVLYFFFVPRAPRSTSPAPHQGGFVESLNRLMEPAILVRLAAMALITGTQRLSTTLSPLITTHAAHGTVVDVGLTACGVALLEMPFMLFWGAMQRRFHNIHVLAVGTVIYATYLVLVSFASAPWHIYLLIGINAFGAAAILCVPLSYLQDLIADRPGLGSSLIAVNMFLSGGVAAALFALGTMVTDYSGTALFGAASGLTAAIAMLALDGRSARTVAA
jgi:predicted MFS family arabinose efflux permease